MKRHNFSGVGERSHGQKNRERHGGSIGHASDPSRVFKGKKMAGLSANKRTKITNLSVAKVLEESNIILINGSIPGSKGGYVEILNQSGDREDEGGNFKNRRQQQWKRSETGGKCVWY